MVYVWQVIVLVLGRKGVRRERREERSETLRAPRFGDSKSNHILRYSEREREERERERGDDKNKQQNIPFQCASST